MGESPSSVKGELSPCAKAVRELPKIWRQRLVEHHRANPLHWYIAAVLLTAGLFVGDWLSHNSVALRLRYRAYQTLNRRPAPYTRSNDVVLVMIGDNEFWRGELARRIPLKKSYLARLVTAIGQGGARVVALDFDMRPTVHQGRIIEHPDYTTETREFARALNGTAETCRCAIVLPQALLAKNGSYVKQPDALDTIGLDGRIRRGHILPFDDIRSVPLSVKTKSGESIDSFATAIASAVNPASVSDARRHPRTLPYARFRQRSFFPTISASEALRAPEHLAHKIVIVGAAWNRYPDGQGQPVDVHRTPAGDIPGAMVHANYVEALLGRETTRAIPEALAIAIEVALSALAAMLFVVISHQRRFQAIVAVNVMAFTFGLIMWHMFALYFDIVIPLILLGAHVATEQVLEWRDRAGLYGVRDQAPEHQVAS